MEDVGNSLSKNYSASAIRLLGAVKSIKSDLNSIEFDESDIVWSVPSISELSDSQVGRTCYSSANVSKSSSTSPVPFPRGKFGLSAALLEDHRRLIQRKVAVRPASAALDVSPPVSASGSEDSSGSAAAAKFHQSAPVNVPIWPDSVSANGSARFRPPAGDDDELDDEMLPPHEIAARSQRMTFSVFEGVGRTLKGRDLRRVRNAVWQKTGFLD